MRTIQIHPLSLAVGAIAVSAAFLLTAQTTPPAQTTWPPPKAMIVNVFEEPAVAISVSAGGTYTVLTVPGDRWLTITGASVSHVSLYWAEETPAGALVNKGHGTISWPVDVNVLGAPIGAPEATPATCGGPLGWTFGPGSSVVIRNPFSSPIQLSLYSLIGYYSRN